MFVHRLRLPCLLMILLLSRVQSKVPSSFIQDVIVAPARCQTKNRNPITYTFISRSWRDHSRLLDLRGGSEEEEESDDESDQGDEQGETDGGLDLTSVLESAANITQSTLIPYTQKAVIVMFKITKKAAITTVKAIQRAIQAGMEGEGEVEEQEDEEVSMVQKVVTTIQRMVKAAFTFPEEEQEEPDSEMSTSDAVEEEGTTEVESEDDEVVEAPPKSTSKVTKDEIPPVSKASDFGTYLATAYGVKDTRVAESGALVLGGSLTTALQEARAQARLLVIFLPAEKPNKKTTDTKEFIAIESILSQEVGEAANQRARSKGEDTGSFLFWGAKAGSSEASTAMKRLKVKPKSSKGGKIPTLMVVYPAMVVDSSTGQPKIVPKVVAQHHCSPPPSSTVMVGWLDTLRKRHAKQYTDMQTVLKELQYFKERNEGYNDSKKNDKERELREKEEERKRLAAEKEEQDRLEALETRRKELLEALPEEAKGKETKKIALRFLDGRSGQRHFYPDQPLTDVFNWVDAVYEIEREKVILTTMNGKQSFTWEENEKNLEDAELGKNIGFRVSIKESEEVSTEDS